MSNRKTKEQKQYITLRDSFNKYYIKEKNVHSLQQLAYKKGLNGLHRKLAWMVFFDILPFPTTDEWIEIFTTSRERYTELLKNKVSTKFDQVIDLDIDRLYTDIDYFKQQHVKDSVRNICQIIAAQNEAIGYQQGFHEMIGLVMFAFTEQQFEKVHVSKQFPQNYERIFDVALDQTYIEHDTFTFIEYFMKFMGKIYSLGSENAYNESNKYFENLKLVNNKLYNKFKRNGIDPTTFGQRWLRVLFSREFDIPTTLNLWDVIFAYGEGMTLVHNIFILLMENYEKYDDDELLLDEWER